LRTIWKTLLYYPSSERCRGGEKKNKSTGHRWEGGGLKESMRGIFRSGKILPKMTGEKKTKLNIDMIMFSEHPWAEGENHCSISVLFLHCRNDQSVVSRRPKKKIFLGPRHKRGKNSNARVVRRVTRRTWHNFGGG